MGKYFKPSTDEAAIGAGGRQLRGFDYRELMKQLGSNECLVGRFDRGLFYLMPLLSTENEYDEFMHQYNGGYLLSYEFYAMPNSVFGICAAASTSSGASARTTASTVPGATASTVPGATASTVPGRQPVQHLMRPVTNGLCTSTP